MTGRVTLVAVVQMNSTPDVPRNLAVARRLIMDATKRGAQLVVLPEHFAYLGPDDGRLRIAEPLPDGGPIMTVCAGLARGSGCELVFGGFPERGRIPGKTRNTCLHLDAEGRVVSIYRKIHLFDVDLPDGTTYRESDSIEPGCEVTVSPTPFGGLGLSICYDVRFPELYRRLVDQGAIALAIPSAFTQTTGADHWHVLVRARAIEAQAYVLAAAQAGHHDGQRSSYGHAMIVDPWGRVLAEGKREEEVVVAQIDPSLVEQVRRQLPSLTHRTLDRT